MAPAAAGLGAPTTDTIDRLGRVTFPAVIAVLGAVRAPGEPARGVAGVGDTAHRPREERHRVGRLRHADRDVVEEDAVHPACPWIRRRRRAFLVGQAA